MSKLEQVDFLFASMLGRYFSIPAPQPTSGAITFAQMRILWVLDRRGAATLSEVAEQICVRRPTATDLVNRLVRLACVRRKRSSVDRRQVVLTLTTKGRRLMAQFARRRRIRLRKLFGTLEDSDIVRMIRALGVVNQVLGKWHGERNG